MPKHGQQEIISIRLSTESHLYSKKKHFRRNPKYFGIYADFEAHNETDYSSIGNKTTNSCNQNPVYSGYYKTYELDDVLKIGYYQSPLRYNNVVWFVNEVKQSESKTVFCFEKFNKDIILTEKDEED